VSVISQFVTGDSSFLPVTDPHGAGGPRRGSGVGCVGRATSTSMFSRSLH
jgi:hypothetical protein